VRTRWLTGPAALAALAVAVTAPAALADGHLLRINPPHHLRFGNQPYGSFTKRGVMIVNQSHRTLAITIDSQAPDDFSPGQPESTCSLSFTTNILSPGERCTMVIGFQPIPEFGGREEMSLTITAATTGGRILRTRHIRVTGTGVPA